MSQEYTADTLQQHKYSYLTNECFITVGITARFCCIFMLEYSANTNMKHTVSHTFVTQVFIQGLTLLLFSNLTSLFLFLSFYFSTLFSKIHTDIK